MRRWRNYLKKRSDKMSKFRRPTYKIEGLKARLKNCKRK